MTNIYITKDKLAAAKKFNLTNYKVINEYKPKETIAYKCVYNDSENIHIKNSDKCANPKDIKHLDIASRYGLACFQTDYSDMVPENVTSLSVEIIPKMKHALTGIHELYLKYDYKCEGDLLELFPNLEELYIY